MAQWDQEKKMAALAIAETATIREASEQTGIPEGTIKRWRSEMRAAEPNQDQQRKKVKVIVEEATRDAKEHVTAFAIEKGKDIAEQLMGLIELSIQEASAVIQLGPSDDEAKAQWLRSVVGAIAQGVEKYNLLTGKPTSRNEVVDNPFAGMSTEELRKLAGGQNTADNKPIN